MRRALVIIGMSVLSALLFYTSSMLTHAQVSTIKQPSVPSVSVQSQLPVGTRITSDDRDGSTELSTVDFRLLVAEQYAAQRAASSASAAAASAASAAARSSARAPTGSNVSVAQDNPDVPVFKPGPNLSNSASSEANTVNTESRQPVPAKCASRRPTFLDLFEDEDVFCSDRGEVFPVLIGGECPITACVLKSGRKVWPGDELGQS